MKMTADNKGLAALAEDSFSGTWNEDRLLAALIALDEPSCFNQALDAEADRTGGFKTFDRPNYDCGNCGSALKMVGTSWVDAFILEKCREGDRHYPTLRATADVA